MRINKNFTALMMLVVLTVLIACTRPAQVTPTLPQSEAETTSSQANTTTGTPSNQETAALQPEPALLDISRGDEIGFVYEAFLSPHQEPGEEEDTPSLTPEEFLSTAPSVPRNERTSRGHGMLRFTNDLSKVYVDVLVENINPDDVVMFHIHCGRPDMLGPILVDFAHSGDIQENLADNLFSVVITNEDIVLTSEAGHGLIGAFTAGCPVVAGLPGDAKTIAGMEYIARQGELYFNLHTKGQTFFGEMRGQLHLVEE